MTLEPQTSLFESGTTPQPSPIRVRSLAGVLAGFAWPGADGYGKLTTGQRGLAEQTAREALAKLQGSR